MRIEGLFERLQKRRNTSDDIPSPRFDVFDEVSFVRYYTRETNYAIRGKNGSLSRLPASQTPAGNFSGVSRRAIVTTYQRGGREEGEREKEAGKEMQKKPRGSLIASEMHSALSRQ